MLLVTVVKIVKRRRRWRFKILSTVTDSATNFPSAVADSA